MGISKFITRADTELGKSFDDYTRAYLGPEGAAFLPTKTEYDIAVNDAAARVPSQTLEGTFPGIVGQALGTVSDLVMPSLALGASPFYDMYQASDRARAQYGQPDVRSVVDDAEIPMGPSFPEYAKAVANENIIRSAIGRTAGAGQNLANRFGTIAQGLGNFFFAPANAPETTEKERQSIELEDDLMNYDEFYEMPEEEEKKNLLERILEFAPFIGDKSLTGILTNALGGAKNKLTGFRDAIGTRLGPSPYGTSQAAFNALTPSQQRSVGSIYGQGGIMQGYNPVSAFGRGPIGSIQNRIADILGRKAAQTAASRQKLADLKNALTDLGGDSDAGYSPGQDAGMGFGGGRSDPTDKS
jgi:hypothetical protein